MNKKLVSVLSISVICLASSSFAVAGPGGGAGKPGGKGGSGFSTRLELLARGPGTLVLHSQPNCASSGHVCYETNTSTLHTSLGDATMVSSLVTDWGDSFSNGQGGFCAPFLSNSLISLSGGTLRLGERGIACQVGANTPTTPLVRSASFAITGGSGDYQGARGSGQMTLGENLSEETVTTQAMLNGSVYLSSDCAK
jgi:hypothetical protein